MKLDIDDIIGLARTMNNEGEILPEVEEFLNLIVDAEQNKQRFVSANEEFGEDLIVSAIKVLNELPKREFSFSQGSVL